MDSYEVDCGLEMDCEEEIDDEDVFRTFLCRGNKEVEVTDQGDMYIIKNSTDIIDYEDISEVGVESGEVKGTFECPEEDKREEDISEEDVNEEDVESSEEEDDGNDKDWTGSDVPSSSDGSSSSCDDDTDEEIGRELNDLTAKVQAIRKKNVESDTKFSGLSFCKKKKGRSNTTVPVIGRKDNKSNTITVFRIGLDHQVMSQSIITDGKSVQVARKNIKECSKIENAQMSSMKMTKLNLQQIKQGSTHTNLPRKIIIKLVQPKRAANISQTLITKIDCSQITSNNTDSVDVREKANQMSAHLVPVKKEVDLPGSETDVINSTEEAQTDCTLKISSVVSQAVETWEETSSMNESVWKGDNSSAFPGRILNEGVDSPLEAFSIGQENFRNLVIKQEPTDDYEPCNMAFKQEPSDDFEPSDHTSIIQASMDDLKPSSNVAIQQETEADLDAYKHVTIKQEPKDEFDLESIVTMVDQSEYSGGHCSYVAVMDDHNYCCRSDVDTPCIKQEPHGDVSIDTSTTVTQTMDTSTTVTQTMLKGDSLGGRSVGSNSSVSDSSQPSHLHLKRKQSAETNKGLEKKLEKNIALDHSTSLKPTMKFPSSNSLPQLKLILQSSQSEVIPSLSPFVIKLPSSQSALKPTLSQSTVKSTLSQSAMKSTTSHCMDEPRQSQSTEKSTLHPKEKTIVLSKYPVKPMLSLTRKTIANNLERELEKTKKLHRNNLKNDEHNNLCPVCKRYFQCMAEMTKHCALHYVHVSSNKCKRGANKLNIHGSETHKKHAKVSKKEQKKSL